MPKASCRPKGGIGPAKPGHSKKNRGTDPGGIGASGTRAQQGEAEASPHVWQRSCRNVGMALPCLSGGSRLASAEPMQPAKLATYPSSAGMQGEALLKERRSLGIAKTSSEAAT